MRTCVSDRCRGFHDQDILRFFNSCRILASCLPDVLSSLDARFLSLGMLANIRSTLSPNSSVTLALSKSKFRSVG